MICPELLQRGNFRCTNGSVGVEAQLSTLASITQVIDPKLHKHLGIFLHMCFCIYFWSNEYNFLTLIVWFLWDCCFKMRWLQDIINRKSLVMTTVLLQLSC